MEDLQASLSTSKWPVKLINKYSSIPFSLPFTQDIILPNITSLPKRSLLLSEMSFYNHINSPCTIIYTSSLDGSHLALLLNLYPNITFLVVNPSFQNTTLDYLYIYKKEHKGLESLSKPALKALHSKKCIDSKLYNPVESRAFGLDYFKKATSLPASPTRLLVIQDYLTAELATQIRSKVHGLLYYVSDIRNDSNDSNTLFSNALHLTIKHSLNCIACITFKPPSPNKEKIVIKDQMVPTFSECKRLGFDFLKEYNSKTNTTYKYLGGEAFIIPWLSQNDNLVRLWMIGGSCTYTLKDWYSKHLYHSFYRAHVFNGLYFARSQEEEWANKYDGCADCILETHILKGYLTKHPHKAFMYISNLLDGVSEPVPKEHNTKLVKQGLPIEYKVGKKVYAFEAEVGSYSF